jgi:hypothetical protein
LESIVSHCSRFGCIEGIDLLRGFIFKICRNANLCGEGAMLCLSLLIEVETLGCEAGRHDVSRKSVLSLLLLLPSNYVSSHVMEISGDAIAEVVLKEFEKWPAKRKPLVRSDGVKEWVPLSGIVAQGLPRNWLVEDHGADIWGRPTRASDLFSSSV